MIFFAANLLAAVSSLSAARIAARFGLINTMVFTHLPSNILLILVPLMPTLALAVTVLLLRFSAEPDGRPDAAVVRDRGRRPGRAVRGGRRDRGRADDRRGDLAVVLVGADGERGLRGPAVLSRGRLQDRLRPAAVPRVPERAPARGARPRRGAEAA